MMARKKYIDAHLHVQDSRFDGSRAAILQQAVACGVEKMVCNAVSEKDWHEVAALAKEYDQVAACFGVHPWYAEQVKEGWLQRLEVLARDGCGIGEIGLDGLVQGDQKKQEEVFCAQLDLASRTGKPVMVHCLKKWGRLLEIIKDYDLAASGMLFHSFGGSQETFFRLLDLGAYFSFSSGIADPSRKKMRQVFLEVPKDRLFLETDAPDQYTPFLFEQTLPAKGREKNIVSKPAQIVQLYDFAAALCKLDPEAFRERIWKNGQIFTN